MRAAPSWNLNCISDKPTLTQPKQTETPLHILLDNSNLPYVRMKRGGGGGGERIFVYSRIQQLAQIKPGNWYPVPMH